MKVRTLDLTPELLVEFCKTCKAGPARRFTVKENPLPDDAEIVAMRQIDMRTIRLYITSESFDGNEWATPALPNVVFQTVYED